MTVYDAAGRPLPLGRRLGGGGEGEVHLVAGRTDRAVKVFHPRRLTSELTRKLAVMQRRRPADPNWATRRHRSFAWVDELVFGDAQARACTGYAMPAVETDRFLQAHAYYDTADRVQRFGGEFTWRHLLASAFNLATAVAALHAEGHRVGDVRETNVLVAPNALVTLVDCDSFEVHGDGGEIFPTRVGTVEYMPPELLNGGPAKAPDRLAADRFGLAVLIFRFLMLGAHPYQARGAAVDAAPSTEAKIRLGRFAFGSERHDLKPPDFAPRWEALPPALRDLFRRAFVTGHRSPEARPAAEEWALALDREGGCLRTCRANPLHRYGGHLRSCPWCAMSRRGRPDPFPAVPRLGAQLPMEAPGAAPSDSERRTWFLSHALLAGVDGPPGDLERAYLRRLGAQIGLGSAETIALTDLGAGVAKSQRQAPQRRARPSVWLVPWALLAAAAGFAAPLLAPPILALAVLPGLSLAGQAHLHLAGGGRHARLLLAAVPRGLQAPLQSLQHLVPGLLPFGLLAAAVAFARPWLPVVPADLLVRGGGAACDLVILGTVWLAAREPADQFLSGLRSASLLANDVIRRRLR